MLASVKSGGQAHHPTNLLSEECGNAHDLFKTSMLQNWSFSSSWQKDLHQHLFDTWAVSAQNQISVTVFTCHMRIDMVASCNLQDAAV